MVTYNPYLRSVQEDPYPVYRELRETDPVNFNPYARMWFLTRHADCVAVLRHPAFSARQGQAQRQRDDPLPVSMLTSDPPEHGRLRSAAAKSLGARAVEELRPALQRVVDDRLGASRERERLEVVNDFSSVVASEALAALLGIPRDDVDRFRALASAASVNLDPMASGTALERGNAGVEELGDYLTSHVSDYLADGRRGGVPPVVAEQVAAGLNRDEVVSTLTLIVIGGYEPLTHTISNGLYSLLRHPQELQRLRDDVGLMERAVEELIRYEAPIQFTARVATEDVAIGTTTIAAGDPVVTLLGAANRDPSIFPDPERLVLDRWPNPHLSFGGGAHFCLGAALARLATRIAIGTLVRSFGEIQLDGELPSFQRSVVPRGLERLTLRLGGHASVSPARPV